MTMDLRELYQEIIIENNRDPRNFRVLADATTKAYGNNPLCGDKVTVYVKLKEGLISDISFVGEGCAIAQASASLMTQAIKGKCLEEAHQLFYRVHQMLTEDNSIPLEASNQLSALAGVKAFPVRVKCASLAWHTLEAALNKEKDTVTTE